LRDGLVLRDRRAVRAAARVPRQPSVARRDDAAPPARSRRPARAALPGAQDHRPRALPLLMARTRELQRLALRLVRLGIVIVGVLLAGTIAFAVSENLSPWEAFRWSLDIVATVGSAAHPKTTGGEVTSTLLIILGVGTLFYGLVTVTEFFV